MSSTRAEFGAPGDSVSARMAFPAKMLFNQMLCRPNGYADRRQKFRCGAAINFQVNQTLDRARSAKVGTGFASERALTYK
jgi:hypothetical protein